MKTTFLLVFINLHYREPSPFSGISTAYRLESMLQTLAKDEKNTISAVYATVYTPHVAMDEISSIFGCVGGFPALQEGRPPLPEHCRVLPVQALRVRQLALPVEKVDAITAKHVRGFLSSVSDRNVADVTLHSFARVIRAWLKFCARKDYLEDCPDFDMPTVEEKRQPVLSNGHMRKLLSACLKG